MVVETQSAAAAEQIAARLAQVRADVRAAAERSGRSASGITIVAVSKTFDDDAVRAARAAGHLDFGESRAQALTARLAVDPPLRARWHFVGRLQRNKVDQVVGRATLIHSVDRLRLAEAIAAQADKLGVVQRVLVQVNVTGDPAKAGVEPGDAAALVSKVRGLAGVSCQGVMTIPALDAEPREAFRELRELRDDLRSRFPEVLHVSMGMSADYEIAVEEGATLVRIGTGIFGPR